MDKRGFTIIELLVVIAIIGLIATVVLVSLNTARVRARTARAISDLKALQLALDLYAEDNDGHYPNSQGGAGVWDGLYSCWGDSTTNWIPGLVPKYLAALPREPRGSSDCGEQYIYNSNGTDYKLIYHNPENCAGVKAQYPNIADPIRNCWAYGFWTTGAAGW